MQHVLVVPDPENPEGAPIAEPHDINLWRDDRLIMWELLAEDWQWSDEHPDRAIAFPETTEWFADGGTEPMPVGPLNGGPDRRVYAAMGPLPATTKKTYTYDILVTPLLQIQTAPLEVSAQAKAVRKRVVSVKKKVCGYGKEIKVDPDISNQPHP